MYILWYLCIYQKREDFTLGHKRRARRRLPLLYWTTTWKYPRSVCYLWVLVEVLVCKKSGAFVVASIFEDEWGNYPFKNKKNGVPLWEWFIQWEQGLNWLLVWVKHRTRSLSSESLVGLGVDMRNSEYTESENERVRHQVDLLCRIGNFVRERETYALVPAGGVLSSKNLQRKCKVFETGIRCKPVEFWRSTCCWLGFSAVASRCCSRNGFH